LFNLKLLTLLTLVCLISIDAAIANMHYRPFYFLDSDIYSRSDLKNRLKVKGFDASENPFAEFRLDDVVLSFFKDIHQLYSELDSIESRVQPLGRCHDIDSALRELSTCSDASNIVSEVERSCKVFDRPAAVFYNLKQNDFDRNKLDSVNGLLEVIAIALDRFEASYFLSSPSDQVRYRQILQKLNFSLAKGILAGTRILLQDKKICPQQEESKLHLLNKIKALSSQLVDTLQSGVDQALQDRLMLQRRGRCRQLLPHPSLTDQDRKFLATYIGGIMWRMRGGGLWKLNGTREARKTFNLRPMIQIAALSSNPALGDKLGRAIYSRISKGWGRYMDMGTTPGESDRYRDLVDMSKRGRYQIESAQRVLQESSLQSIHTKAGGYQMGACYYYPYYAPVSITTSIPASPIHSFIDGATAWGELCTGAAISLGITKDLLNGHGCTASEPIYKTVTIQCESWGKRDHFCPVAGDLLGIDLVKQLSRSRMFSSSGRCTKDRTFQLVSGGIQVKKGCRAIFKVKVQL
jgi:hypothetical protein